MLQINLHRLLLLLQMKLETVNNETVNPNAEFVTEDGVNTNTIQGLWGRLKQKISKMHRLKGIKAL